MARANIYRTDEITGEKTLEGWFNTDTARWIREDTYWDGNNMRGMMSGLQCGYEGLYRTAKSRWVRYYNARNEYNGPEYYEFLTDGQARDWLLRNGDDAIAEEYFGTIEDERGPGRPEIGPAVNVRFPQDLLDRLDARAKTEGTKRAELVRRLVAAGLS